MWKSNALHAVYIGIFLDGMTTATKVKLCVVYAEQRTEIVCFGYFWELKLSVVN